MSRINTDRLKLELRRARMPALQYIFVAAAAIFALVVLLGNQYFDKPWVQKTEYKIQFDDVKGVVPGQQRVRMAGVDVGIITDSEVGPQNKPVLTVKLEDKFGTFYKNAEMRLRPLTPLQDIYLDITDRGDRTAGKLDEGDTLTGARTTSSVDVSRVLNTFDDDTQLRMRTLITQFSKGLDGDGGRQLRETFVQLAPFLQAAQRTTGVVADRRQNMKRLVHNLSGLTEALGERDNQLTSLVSDGSATLTEIGRNQRPFDATLAQLPRLLSTMRTSFSALRAAEDQLDPALRSLRPVSQQLESGLDALQQFTADVRPTLSALRPSVRTLAPLTRSLQPTARSLDSAVKRLQPQAKQFDSLTGELPPCFDQLADFFNTTLSVLKFSGDYGPFPRGENFSDPSSGPGAPIGDTEAGVKAPNLTSGVQLCTKEPTIKVTRSTR